MDNNIEMSQWEALVRKNRPKISDSSVKTYLSVIGSLCREMAIESPKLDFFDKHDGEVLLYTKNMSFQKRKNILASVLSVTTDEKAQEKYRKTMLSDIQQYNTQIKKQEMTDKQKDAWISQDELKAIYTKLEKEAKPLMNSASLNKHDFKKVQSYVILSLYTIIPPRRLLDYTNFKLKNINEETDNYMKGRFLFFNTYKTAKVYHEQKIPCPMKLHSILTRWKSIQPSDWLLTNSRGEHMSPSQLVLVLNSILGKKASVNALRHSFLSEKLKDVPALTELQELATDMGHNLATQMEYKKIK